MSQTSISSTRARRVWDSRGLPTIEVEIELVGGARGRAIAPSGASCGSLEAVELRDGGKSLGGKDVSNAIEKVHREVAPAVQGLDTTDQSAIDERLVALDGTPNLHRLGGNSTVAVSLAALHAAAAASHMPLWQYVSSKRGHKPTLPLPEVQIFGGGAHAARRVAVQDFMIITPGADSFAETLAITAEVYRAAGQDLARQGRLAGVADEGGWWPAFDSNEEALDTLVRAIEIAGLTPGDDVVISLDVAANQLRKGDAYSLTLDDMELTNDALIERLGSWIGRYPIVAIEDPLSEGDEAGFVSFTRSYGRSIQVVGDDLLVTNAERIQHCARIGACNTALIKVNQAGTVTRAFDAFDAARAAGLGTIVSARSGETEDISICHLAVGLGAGQLKVGSLSRGERTAKWNECLRIEEKVGEFAGFQPLARTWWNAQ